MSSSGLDNKVQRGLFITLEGGEGSGKTTQIATVKEYFQAAGYDVVCTREPGGTKIAERIRSILLTKEHEEDLCSISELLLMYASRAQLVNTLIKPMLEQGKIVISDRFDLSTVAYQGAGRGFDLETISKLREIAIGNFKPDLTLLLDVDVKLGMERVLRRSARDRFEQEAEEFFTRIRQGFIDYAAKHTDEVYLIDGSSDEASVANAVRAALDKKFAHLVKAK